MNHCFARRRKQNFGFSELRQSILHPVIFRPGRFASETSPASSFTEKLHEFHESLTWPGMPVN